MKSILTKKVIIIFSILIAIVATAVIIAFSTGNTRYPSLSDPDGIFYERLDDQGKVMYSISNKELYETIKAEDGLQQLLLLADTTLLKDYLDQVTDDMIADKILILKYGSSDPDKLALIDEETIEQLDNSFKLNMLLLGYDGNEEEYASILLAREMYAREQLRTDDTIKDLDVAKQFLNKTFADIQAVRIRFTSTQDYKAVMQKFNLLDYDTKDLREYLGYYFKNETFLDNQDNIVEAYITVHPFYFDDKQNICDYNETIVYTIGEGDIYVDNADKEYTLDNDGNLIDADQEVIIEAALLFDSFEEADTYKEENTTYYTVTKTDPFDENENPVVKDNTDTVVYILKDNKVYDTEDNDVTTTSGLYVNKVFAKITSVAVATLNNSRELTDEEVLHKYILMYNYVYGAYRTPLPEAASIADLIALESEDLMYSFADVNEISSDLAAYMFKTIDLENEDASRYSSSGKAFAISNTVYYYMVFKLNQGDDKKTYEETMLDNIVTQIRIPTTIGDTIAPMTSSWYDSAISWTSANNNVITGAGVVTKPNVDTEVELTYRITFNGRIRTGKVTVTVLANGETIPVEASTDTEIPFKTILDDDDLYDDLAEILVEEKMTDSNSSNTINTYLNKLRAKYNFKIYDYLIGLEYHNFYIDYDHKTKGNKRLVASLSGRPGAAETAIEFTADDLFTYALTKNPSVYLMYASRFKEILTTPYYQTVFGSEKRIMKNKSEKMEEMLKYVDSVKNYYAYLQQLYAQYNMEFPYASFNDYIYLQFNGAKSETDLLEKAIVSALQDHQIRETINNYDLLELMYPTIEEYYDNYFSLYVTHLLVFLDFDENDRPDDYIEYVDGLAPADADALDALIAALETDILAYLEEESNTLFTLASDYKAATREDETWGVYKQKGLFLLTQELNKKDDKDVKHSLEYFGDYGVSDELIPEFVTALKDLYDEYNLPQNIDNEEMLSSIVETKFGNHLILGTKGDYFTQPSAAFAEADPDNPIYDPDTVNPNDKPTLKQIQLYAEYFFYDKFYDLSEPGVEAKYGFTYPKIKASLRTAIATYAKDLVSSSFVIGTININQATKMARGRFIPSDYYDQTNAELIALFEAIKDAHFKAMYGKYEND
ncbi:MAG: hypothetical protein GX904_04495 [Acholeplasmataceae bacterium]|nr:hypothetical protein [Acholeplasmataceae bacterium]